MSIVHNKAQLPEANDRVKESKVLSLDTRYANQILTFESGKTIVVCYDPRPDEMIQKEMEQMTSSCCMGGPPYQAQSEQKPVFGGMFGAGLGGTLLGVRDATAFLGGDNGGGEGANPSTINLNDGLADEILTYFESNQWKLSGNKYDVLNKIISVLTKSPRLKTDKIAKLLQLAREKRQALEDSAEA